jgi:transcription initiation factor TFIID TATA-box-binding protein
MNPELVNAVGGGDLDVEINLHNAVDALEEFSPSYEPEVAPGLHFELPQSSVTVMVFRTGSYHLTGAKSRDELSTAHDELIDILESSLGLCIKSSTIEVRNLVYSGELDREIDLAALSSELGEGASYAPEVDPGLKLRLADHCGLFTLYRTGAYIYTGEKDEKKAAEAISDSISQIKLIMD